MIVVTFCCTLWFFNLFEPGCEPKDPRVNMLQMKLVVFSFVQIKRPITSVVTHELLDFNPKYYSASLYLKLVFEITFSI